eukprot:scaffold2065_cov114-Isochrysis_galbana.AAC.4
MMMWFLFPALLCLPPCLVLPFVLVKCARFRDEELNPSSVKEEGLSCGGSYKPLVNDAMTDPLTDTDGPGIEPPSAAVRVGERCHPLVGTRHPQRSLGQQFFEDHTASDVRELELAQFTRVFGAIRAGEALVHLHHCAWPRDLCRASHSAIVQPKRLSSPCAQAFHKHLVVDKSVDFGAGLATKITQQHSQLRSQLAQSLSHRLTSERERIGAQIKRFELRSARAGGQSDNYLLQWRITQLCIG